MSATAILFPGQGSLTPEAAERARKVCPVLVQRARTLLGADPFEAAGRSTEFAQPAIFLASMAGWMAYPEGLVGACAMAGHSLGELSALAAAGALDVNDALNLVVLRGRLMASAVHRAPPAGMVALLGVDSGVASALAQRNGVVVANDNAPGQWILSGSRSGIEGVVLQARSAGARALELDVVGAFHSPDMAPAEEPFRRALEAVPLSPPVVPVISGYTAQPFSSIRMELARAVVSPVRWRETMNALVGVGASRFVDIGPGRVLERLVKRNLAAQDHVAAA